MSETISNEIKEKVLHFLNENFLFSEEDSIGDEDSFLEHGVLDSTGVLELIEFVEETFNIAVDDEEMVPENLDSIQNLLSFIMKKTT